MRWAAIIGLALAVCGVPAAAQSPAQEQARAVVEASAPNDLSVTIYRDPDRDVSDDLDRDRPQGFALISETRRVTLPAGPSTIRFIGVSEGMIGVSAIVSGLPGGTIEKNRDAELLSPAALVNGALGNRVTITRTSPGSGVERSEQAVVRTRADGGLVLETSQGFEAVRCSGLPEKLTFARIPPGLNAKPVFSVNTRSETGGTYEVTLTYLSWGFDWQANYVTTLGEKARGEELKMNWLSWLTLVNDNGQSFNNAKLQIIAGELNIESDYEGLADLPVAERLRLTCYPLGSTKTGSPVPYYDEVYASEAAADMMPSGRNQRIVVTGSRRKAYVQESPISVVTASEEDLGDLKLFRVPERVDVSAKGMKQVAFLNKDAVKGRFLYTASCEPYDWIEDLGEPEAATMFLETKNEERRGLGIALPQGMMRVFEPTSRGTQISAITELRDYARGQEVELELGESAQVFAQCARLLETDFDDESRKWSKMVARVTNANPHPVQVRVNLGWAPDYNAKVPRGKVRVKNGYKTVEITVPANDTYEFTWKLRSTYAE